MRRQLAAVAAALLVVLAGCSGLPFGGGSDGPTVDSVTYPDGTSKNGITNTTAVVQSHQQSLSDTSFVLVQEQSRQLGNRGMSVTLRIAVDDDQQRFTSRTTRGNMSATTYYENGTIFSKQVVNGTTRYDVQPYENQSYETLHSRFTAASTIGQLVQTLELNAEDVRQTEDTTLIVYNITGAATPPSQQTGQKQSGSLSGTVVIDTEGRFHEITLSREGRLQTVTLQIRFDKVGETQVNRPVWLSTAREQASNSTATNSTTTPSGNQTPTATEKETATPSS